MSKTREQVHYFGAGPAPLPTSVLEQASQDLLNYKGTGLGLGEISHRSSQAIAIINETVDNVTKVLNVPDTHSVFFAQGGGTGGFAAVVYNMLAAFAYKTHRKGKVDYIVTGSWSDKASQEAKRLGADVNIVVDSRKFNDGKFGTIPSHDNWHFSDPNDTAYVYYCDNETVHGVEFPEIPEIPQGVELVADMSSNFMSRKVDVSKFGLIFGGAQKNIGIPGISLYIIKKSLLQRLPLEEANSLNLPVTPIVLDFPIIVKNNSSYNTVSIFAIHITNLYMKLLLERGGLEVQERESKQKAKKLYDVLDSYPNVYHTLVDNPVRSNMNIVLTIPGDGLEQKFLKQAEELGLSGLKGHRSVGGIRISNYNAVTPQSVDLLVKFIKDFANSVV